MSECDKTHDSKKRNHGIIFGVKASEVESIWGTTTTKSQSMDGVNPEVFDRVREFVSNQYAAAYAAGLPFTQPAIALGDGGSIDLHWFMDEHKLTFNIPKDPDGYVWYESGSVVGCTDVGSHHPIVARQLNYRHTG